MTASAPAANTPVALSELELQPEYRSDADHLLRDFYLPCLQRSSLYRRAVGYFTSRGLAVAAQGITALVNGGGRMLLVASPLFDAEDLEAIAGGYSARDDVVARALLREIEATPNSAVHHRLGYLAWLIAEGRLDVRIAIPLGADGKPRGGIYHEKLGIFSDPHGNAVAFTGSPNETEGGLVDNFEATDVFWSWDDPHRRVARKIQNFSRLWENQTSGLLVAAFPDAVGEQLLRYRPSEPPGPESSDPLEAQRPAADFPEDLWEHQIEAIEAWEANDRRGIMSMATGSGKTWTALAAGERCPGLVLSAMTALRASLPITDPKAIVSG